MIHTPLLTRLLFGPKIAHQGRTIQLRGSEKSQADGRAPTAAGIASIEGSNGAEANMRDGPLANVVERLRQAVLAGTETDAHLVQEFLSCRSEHAFRILLRRHG